MDRGAAIKPAYTSLSTRDFDELATAFRRWENRFRQVSRGPFQGSLERLQFGGIEILRVSTNRRLHAEGLLPADMHSFVPVHSRNEEAIWKGRRLRSGQLRTMAPSEEMDHMTTDDYQAVVLLVDQNLFQKYASLIQGSDPLEKMAGMKGTPGEKASVQDMGFFLSMLLDQATVSTDSFVNPESSSLLEQECLRRMIRAVNGGYDSHSYRASNSVLLVQRAEEFLESCLAQPLTVFDLCREFNVSERTLHYAFREVRGLSPKAYIKSKRLNAVRQDLKARAADTIHEIAQRWGFWHTGEFASAYHRLFGEFPSDTFQELHKESDPPR